MAKKKFHSKASQFLYNRYIAGDPKREEEYEEQVINADIARKIFELRTKAGLTQQELAHKVGTSKSAICRLEDADYEGHSLFMLKRIAEAVDKRLEIDWPRQNACGGHEKSNGSLAPKKGLANRAPRSLRDSILRLREAVDLRFL